MCNLCSVTKRQQATREFYRAMHDYTGNMLPLPGVFPDYVRSSGLCRQAPLPR